MRFLCLQEDIVIMILMVVEEEDMMTTIVVTGKRLPKLMKDMAEGREAVQNLWKRERRLKLPCKIQMTMGPADMVGAVGTEGKSTKLAVATAAVEAVVITEAGVDTANITGMV